MNNIIESLHIPFLVLEWKNSGKEGLEIIMIYENVLDAIGHTVKPHEPGCGQCGGIGEV